MRKASVHRKNAENSNDSRVVVQEFSKILLINEEIHKNLRILAEQFPEERQDAMATIEQVSEIDCVIQGILSDVNGRPPVIPIELIQKVDAETDRIFGNLGDIRKI